MGAQSRAKLSPRAVLGRILRGRLTLIGGGQTKPRKQRKATAPTLVESLKTSLAKASTAPSTNCVTIARWDESAHGPCRSNPFPIGGAWLMSARRSVQLASLKRAGNEQAATTEAHAKELGQRQQDQGVLDSLATTFRERVARVSLFI